MKSSVASDYKKRLCFLICEIVNKTLYVLCLRYIMEGMRKGDGKERRDLKETKREELRNEKDWKRKDQERKVRRWKRKWEKEREEIGKGI